MNDLKKGFFDPLMIGVISTLMFIIVTGPFFKNKLLPQTTLENLSKNTKTENQEVLSEKQLLIPEGWKTYTNSNHNYEFSYPSDGMIAELGPERDPLLVRLMEKMKERKLDSLAI